MIFRSPYSDATIPEVPLTPFVLQQAERLGDKPALIEGASGRTITYEELAAGVRRVGSSLIKRGMKKGDVFAIYSPNLPEYAVAFHAVSLIGGVNTTVNPLYTAEELAHQLCDCNARFLLTVPQFLDKAFQAAEAAGIEEVFVFGEAEGATPFASLLQGDGELPDISINPKEDLVVLPYSSGTTGLPKGVMLTHYNLVANVVQTDGIESISEGETLIAVLPFFHIYGLEILLNMCLYHGATLVTMPRFDLEEFLKIMQNYKVTRAHLVPPILVALAKHPMVDQYDLSSLQRITSGAAPLSGELGSAVGERLGCIVKQGYGMTEASPVTHITPDQRERVRPGTVGVAVRNMEYKIVDHETGKELEIGELGEVWVRGPNVMKGYLNQPEATAKTIDADGWLHTGDIGMADEEGYLTIVDRAKELIKYKGFQVAPAELEALLLSHPAVADAAVVPSPDEEAGEVPVAYVVLKGETTPNEIIEFVAQRVAPHKKIRRVMIIQQIPKSASGKILRRVLVEQERDAVAKIS